MGVRSSCGPRFLWNCPPVEHLRNPLETSRNVRDTSEHVQNTSEHLQNTSGISGNAPEIIRKHQTNTTGITFSSVFGAYHGASGSVVTWKKQDGIGADGIGVGVPF